MIATLLRTTGVLLFALGTLIAIAGNAGATTAGSVKMQWKTLPTISLVVTPNYQAGFGPQGGAGSGSTPAPGPLASLGGGDVDFGSNVVQGYQYLYKYAAQATVKTNDLSGFAVYAEGTTDVNDTTMGGTVPLSQTLYWLKNSGANNPFTPANAFQPTTAPVGCGNTCINYPGNPPP
ncbi:MAG: hypothetical protein M3Y21_03330, partial [Candidatus Eremiobacteraeota bacterium]|nr:hypothetical protein [Candidatus Eremiobacteraeota bacterium]